MLYSGAGQMAAKFYINQAPPEVLGDAPTDPDARTAYRAALAPAALVAATLEDPEVARLARAYGDGGKSVWYLANEVVDRLEPVALRAVRAFGKFEQFAGSQTERASRISFHVMRPLFGIAIKVLGWAVRLTSPATSRVLAMGLKVAVPEIIAALGLGQFAAPLLALSDPRCKRDIRPAGERARRAGVALLHVKPVNFKYRKGAAVPDDLVGHLGVLANDPALLKAKLSDGERVSVMDIITALIVLMQMQNKDIKDMQAQIAQLCALVGI